MDAFIQALPKAECHIHLETSVPWHLVRTLYDTPVPETPLWWQEDFRFADFTEFDAALRPVADTLRTVEDYHTAAAAVFAAFQAQNGRYIEISFGPQGVRRRGLALHEVAQALHAAAPDGLVVKVIAGINRTREITPEMQKAILNTPGIDGIDLHGDERKGHAALFTEIYREAKEKGFIVRAHAGETLGADHIRDTLEYLQTPHLMHGIRAAEDEALLQRIIDEQISLHSCPTSNIKLGVFESMQVHPIAEFLRKGARITINTDGATMFGCSLTDEIRTVAAAHALTKQEIAQFQINAFESAALPPETRAAILAEIESLL